MNEKYHKIVLLRLDEQVKYLTKNSQNGQQDNGLSVNQTQKKFTFKRDINTSIKQNSYFVKVFAHYKQTEDLALPYSIFIYHLIKYKNDGWNRVSFCIMQVTFRENNISQASKSLAEMNCSELGSPCEFMKYQTKKHQKQLEIIIESWKRNMGNIKI